jgi:hypothetical protein
MRHEGAIVSISPGAIEFAADETEIHLQKHGGSVLLGRGQGGLQLWADEEGLWFEASLPNTPLLAQALWLIRHRSAGVSVGLPETEDVEFERSGENHRVIAWAQLDHFALTLDAAFQTAVWVADDERSGDLPPHLVAMTQRWSRARERAEASARATLGSVFRDLPSEGLSVEVAGVLARDVTSNPGDPRAVAALRRFAEDCAQSRGVEAVAPAASTPRDEVREAGDQHREAFARDYFGDEKLVREYVEGRLDAPFWAHVRWAAQRGVPIGGNGLFLPLFAGHDFDGGRADPIPVTQIISGRLAEASRKAG